MHCAGSADKMLERIVAKSEGSADSGSTDTCSSSSSAAQAQLFAVRGCSKSSQDSGAWSCLDSQDISAEDIYGSGAAPRPAASSRRRRQTDLKSALNLEQFSSSGGRSANCVSETPSGRLNSQPQSLSSVFTAQPESEAKSQDLTAEDVAGTTLPTVLLAVNPACPATMRRDCWSAKDYTLLQQMHQGYASCVYKARCNISGQCIALKVYNLAAQEDIPRMQLFREISLHSKLQHKHIVQFFAAFLEDGKVYIVQEYAGGGDLLHYLHQRCTGRMREARAVTMVLQPLLDVLLYLHSQGIVHRDIKPENIFFALPSWELKLGDFGLAIDVTQERANTRAGTLEYMSPEVLLCRSKVTPDDFKSDDLAQHYSSGADIWALGSLMYELVVGVLPFKADSNSGTASNIMHTEVSFPKRTSPAAIEFIRACLSKHVGDRPTSAELLQAPWACMPVERAAAGGCSTSGSNLNPRYLRPDPFALMSTQPLPQTCVPDEELPMMKGLSLGHVLIN